jgi:glutaredoxin
VVERGKMKKLLIVVILIGGLIQAFILAKDHCYRWVPYNDGITITLYGRPDCPLCKGLRGRLEQNRIPYTFINVNNDAQATGELYQLIRNAHGNDIRQVVLPVVQIADQVLISPDITKVTNLYGIRKFVFPGFH